MLQCCSLWALGPGPAPLRVRRADEHRRARSVDAEKLANAAITAHQLVLAATCEQNERSVRVARAEVHAPQWRANNAAHQSLLVAPCEQLGDGGFRIECPR